MYEKTIFCSIYKSIQKKKAQLKNNLDTIKKYIVLGKSITFNKKDQKILQ